VFTRFALTALKSTKEGDRINPLPSNQLREKRAFLSLRIHRHDTRKSSICHFDATALVDQADPIANCRERRLQVIR